MIQPSTIYLLSGLLMGGFAIFLLVTLLSKVVLRDYFKRKSEFLDKVSKIEDKGDD